MLLSFIVATTVVSLMPGPSMIVIMMNSIDRGLAQGIQTIAGAVLADAILLLLTLSGVGTILYTSALAFSLLKWFGVLYLIYLGYVQLKSKVEEEESKAARPGNAFLQGLGTTLLNPKIIGFLIVFFPQFLNREESVLKQLFVLGPLFLLIVFIVFLLCALAARSIRGAMASRKGKVVFKNVSGISLIGCGLLSAGM